MLQVQYIHLTIGELWMRAVAVLFIGLVCVPSYSIAATEVERQAVFDTAAEFSKCAAHFEAMSWFSEKIGKSEAAAQFKNSYRGWMMGGAWLMFSTGITPDFQKALNYSEALSETEAQRLKSYLESNMPEAQEEINKIYEVSCKPYIEYQESLVAEMRKTLATSPE